MSCRTSPAETAVNVRSSSPQT
ncbi:MAG: hypothetical protein LCH80_22135 [Proteobacteria bacterium]|nr:hypothetical protein [Pseudomonadota bacterium]